MIFCCMRCLNLIFDSIDFSIWHLVILSFYVVVFVVEFLSLSVSASVSASVSVSLSLSLSLSLFGGFSLSLPRSIWVFIYYLLL